MWVQTLRTLKRSTHKATCTLATHKKSLAATNRNVRKQNSVQIQLKARKATHKCDSNCKISHSEGRCWRLDKPWKGKNAIQYWPRWTSQRSGLSFGRRGSKRRKTSTTISLQVDLYYILRSLGSRRRRSWPRSSRRLTTVCRRNWLCSKVNKETELKGKSSRTSPKMPQQN